MQKDLKKAPTFFLLYLAASYFLYFFYPGPKLIYSPNNLFGVLLIIFGIVINVWADNLFKEKNTTFNPYGRPANFIIRGPFRFSRNPMYLGFTSILFGYSILMGNATAFIFPIAMFLTYNFLYIPHEERVLEDIFGEEYVNYKKRVRRWL